MAFVLDVTKTAGTEGVNATTLTFVEWFAADDGLLAGDYIMVVCSNQLGTGTALELTSSTGSWTKLDSTDSPRVGTFMRSQVWWHKYDGTTLPTEPTASEGASTAWAAVAWVVRDAPDVADQSWIDVNARADNTTAARVITIPSATTTEADCLLLTVFTSSGASAFETPDRFWGMDLSVAKTGDNSLVSNQTQRAIVASRAQFTAGATPTYDYVTANAGGSRSQIWNIAIKNKIGGAKPIGIANPPTRVFDYYEDNTFTTAATVLTDLSTIHATIDGQTTFAPALIANVSQAPGLITNNPPILFWYRRIRVTPPTATTGVSGVRWDLPATTDYTAGLWVLFSQRASANTDSLAGTYHYFEDSTGNWAVYRPLTRLQGALYNTLVRYLPDETIVDGSVTPVDLTDITKRGVAYHQIASSTQARDFHFARECVQPFAAPLTLIGGGPANPITARTVARMLDSGGAWNLSFTQGQSQQVITMPYQLGDATVATYVDEEAQALEYPRAGGILGYTVDAGRQEIRVKASASDTILLDAGIKGTSRIHDFVFDSASSTSATYGVAGTFLGFDFTAKTGINIQGATLIECPEIDAKGAQFNNCVIKKTTSVDAAIAFDANSSMDGTTIDVTGTSADFHIELGASVTAFTLTDVTFLGTPGTDKVNVLATAGTVDITLSGTTLVAGDITSAGATVNLIAPLKTASITGILAGSKVRIYNVTTATEVYINTPGTSYSATYTDGTTYTAGDSVNIRIHKRGRLTFDTTVVAAISGWAANANQIEDEVYTDLAIDGSTVTGFAADYINNEVNVTIAANFSIADLYAWWSYNLESDDGIRNFVGGITAIDTGNFRINNGVVNLYIDNTTATNLRQLDNRRIFRADQAYPVKSSGGGGIDVVWRNQILIAVVSTVSSVITGDIADVPARVQQGMTAQGYTAAKADNLDASVQDAINAAKLAAALSA